MKKLVAMPLLPALALFGCQRDDSAVKEKLEEINKRLVSIEDSIKNMPRGQGAAAPRNERPRPSPTDVYSVAIDGSPTLGNPSAKVTIIEGFEFACPFCRKVGPTVEQLKKDYGDDLRIVKKQYVVHPQVATLPAQAACAAHRQGKYEQYERLLWEKGFDAGRNFAAENIEALAKEAGLSVDKLKADMAGACKAQIEKEQASLAAVGTSGTPAFYINGRFLSGARPIEQFKAVIDEELKKANGRIGKEGITAENYYQKVVVEGGKKRLDG